MPNPNLVGLRNVEFRRVMGVETDNQTHPLLVMGHIKVGGDLTRLYTQTQDAPETINVLTDW